MGSMSATTFMAANWKDSRIFCSERRRAFSNGPASGSASGGFSWGFCGSTAFSLSFILRRFKILKLGTFQRPAGLQHGRNDTLVVHAHGAQHSYFGGQSAGHADGHPNERQVFHRRVGILEPDADGQLAGRLFQEAVEQFHETLLLFQGMEKKQRLMEL